MSTQQSRFILYRFETLFNKDFPLLCFLPTDPVCYIKITDIESRISALTVAGLNIAPCGRLTRKRDQKQRNQVRLSLTPSVGILHGLEILEDKICLASRRCIDCCVLFVGPDYRHIKAAEEETACSTGERYA